LIHDNTFILVRLITTPGRDPHAEFCQQLTGRLLVQPEYIGCCHLHRHRDGHLGALGNLLVGGWLLFKHHIWLSDMALLHLEHHKALPLQD
jgi:hypothetical protein